MNTLEILQSLQAEVGTRRAGTDGERRAQQWLKARCEALGLQVEMDEFSFIGSEKYRPLLSLVMILVIGLIIGLLISDQVFIAAGIFIAYFLAMNLRKKLELRLATSRSQNVIAGLKRPISEFVSDENKGTAILVCAHYDTPRNFPTWFPKVREAVRYLVPLSSLGVVLFGVFIALTFLGNLIPAFSGLVSVASWIGWVALLFSLPFLIGSALFSIYILVSKKTDSPGTDDNGSGISTVIDLAQRFQKKPTDHIEVFFAWWGAEELGLFGSRQFVRRFHHKLNKKNFHILNIDCVGVGEYLTVHVGQGVWKRHATDPDTVARIERLASSLKIKSIRSWESPISGGSSDHAEWVDRGYRHATSLIREDYRPLSWPARLYAWIMRIPYANQLELRHIHTPADTLDCIKPGVLHGTANLAEAYIREIDSDTAK